MRASLYHINTFKEVSSETETISHQLLIRTGMINKLAGGIYTYMPLGLKVIRKIENIIRKEMNSSGAIELLMPILQPSELWIRSGRWTQYGQELMRFQDRRRRGFALQATSEEVITDIACNEIRSYRQLPITFYHIQNKFRDEHRPRFGLIRGREFIMKDAYSFDSNENSSLQSYQKMHDLYTHIFKKLRLQFRAVTADTGTIGGSHSHEFHAIANTGEDLIVYNTSTSYAANIELAEAPCLLQDRGIATKPLCMVPTLGATKCKEVAQLLDVPLQSVVRSIVLATKSENSQVEIWLVLIRSDHELNEVKVRKVPGLREYHLATASEILEYFGCSAGFLGPLNTIKPVHMIVDLTVAKMANFVCGANRSGYHYRNVNWVRDLPEPRHVVDLRNAEKGDLAPDGKSVLSIQRGIEIGHIFLLGTKYSIPFKATFLNKFGKPEYLRMGCYGIGISRILGAFIEQNHDARGIIWARDLAPFEVVICPIGWDQNINVNYTSLSLYESLKEAGVDVILDDRNIRPGVMFAEWDLIGIPLRVVVGNQSLQNGVVELQFRRRSLTINVPVEKAPEKISSELVSL